jgi:hypothetical protein
VEVAMHVVWAIRHLIKRDLESTVVSARDLFVDPAYATRCTSRYPSSFVRWKDSPHVTDGGHARA